MVTGDDSCSRGSLFETTENKQKEARVSPFFSMATGVVFVLLIVDLVNSK